MKKSLCVLILTLFTINCTACSNNANSNSNVPLAENSQTTSAIYETVEETTLEQETTQEESLSPLSEDDFIKNIASDFSTDEVKFTYKKSDDNFYLLDSENDNVKIDVSIFKAGDEFLVDYVDVIFTTDGTDDVCYRTLVKMLKSDVFDLRLTEQMDILVAYKNGEISFENSSLTISEGQKDNIRVIGFNFK